MNQSWTWGFAVVDTLVGPAKQVELCSNCCKPRLELEQTAPYQDK